MKTCNRHDQRHGVSVALADKKGNMMKLCMIQSFSALLVCLTLGGQALAVDGSDAVVAIDAIGVGTSAELAQKDALMNAVQQAVGMYIQGETLVENSELIHEKILSASNGFVENFTVTIPPHKRATDGLFQVSIRANVRRGKVAEQLRQVHLISSDVDIAKQWAEAFTKMKTAEEANRLLDEYLKGLAVSLLKPQIVGAGADGQQPTTKMDGNSGNLWCAWSIEIKFDRKRYYEEVRPRLKRILETMATEVRQQPVSRVSAYSIPKPVRTVGVSDTPSRRLPGTSSRIRWLPGGHPFGKKGDFDDELKALQDDEVGVVMDITNRESMQQAFAWYVLPGKYKNTLSGRVVGAVVQVRLIDEDGQVISRESLRLEETALEPLDRRGRRREFHIPFDAAWYRVARQPLLLQHNKHSNAFLIAPEFPMGSVNYTGDGGIGKFHDAVTDALLVRYEVSLTPEEVKKIKRVEVTLVEEPRP